MLSVTGEELRRHKLLTQSVTNGGSVKSVHFEDVERFVLKTFPQRGVLKIGRCIAQLATGTTRICKLMFYLRPPLYSSMRDPFPPILVSVRPVETASLKWGGFDLKKKTRRLQERERGVGGHQRN